MDLLDTVSLSILLGAILVLAGILSSLVAMRFGAPLLLVFLILGMLAGESGPGGIKFDDVQTAYLVGSVALALILFDGGLRTRFQTFRSVLAPALVLATIGVLLTAGLTAPIAKYFLDIGWIEALLIGAVVASTDAAAVFLLVHARGLRLRPRLAATLEIESGTNDPFAVFLTIVPVQFLLDGPAPWQEVAVRLVQEAVVGTVTGIIGGRTIVWALNRLGLPQGLHAPFVAVGALVVFGLTQAFHGSGYLAAYLAGLVVGNRPTRAHNTVVVFLDAVTWLAQIVMFVLLGLLVWPGRLPLTLGPALLVALVLMLVARPVRCSCAWRHFASRCAKSCSSLGSAARRRRHLPRFDSRCWWGCRTRTSISTSPSWWCCCRFSSRDGASSGRRACSEWRCRAAIRPRAASSSTCRASSLRNWWATASVPTARISAGASHHHGRSSRW